MEDTTMIKKDYMKPEMQTVEGSVDPNGINNGLIEDEVTEGWAPEFNDVLNMNNEIFGIK